MGYKLYRGGTWRGEYIILGYDAFRKANVGHHTTDHSTKDADVPGSAADDAEPRSFPFRERKLRSFDECSLADQAPYVIPHSDGRADNVFAAMDAVDGDPSIYLHVECT